MNEVGLLARLSKYRPREGRNSLEDFITETFAWLLQRNGSFQRAFLQQVSKKLSEKDMQLYITPETTAEWLTQEKYRDSRFDMVAKLENSVVIFEHKAYAVAYGEQIEKYLNQAPNYARVEFSYVVMITANQSQFVKKADACLCWEDIYRLIDDFLERGKVDALAEHILLDFQELLQYHGLGPAAPVSNQAVQAYPVVRGFETSLTDLFHRVAQQNWAFIQGFELADIKENRLGRIGLSFVGRKSKRWDPGFMLVVVLDGADLGIGKRVNYELKLHFVLSFIDEKQHQVYPYTREYKALKKDLQALDDPQGWQFYDQFEESTKGANKYHPLMMEYSLLEILQGNSLIGQQVEQVYSKTKVLIEKIQALDGLKMLQKKLMS